MTFVGKDEHGGVPSQSRPEVDPPPFWRLEMVAAVERPRHVEVSPDGKNILFLLDRDTSDAWLVPTSGGSPRRLTVDRELAAFWEDTPPVWSPDGSRVAYVTAGKLRVVSTGGGPSRELLEADNPVWVDDQHLLVTIERKRCSRLAQTRRAGAPLRGITEVARPKSRFGLSNSVPRLHNAGPSCQPVYVRR